MSLKSSICAFFHTPFYITLFGKMVVNTDIFFLNNRARSIAYRVV